MVLAILDANIIIQDFVMESGHFRRLFEAAASGQITVAVPEVALREAASHYAQTVESHEGTITKALRDLRRACNIEADVTELLELLHSRSATYHAWVESAFSSPNCRVLPLPGIELEALVSRSIDRKPPFSQGDKGFKDAVIWHSILEAATEHSDIALVTLNTKDFAEPGSDPPRLNDALADDVGRLTHGTASVVLFSGLREFILQAEHVIGSGHPPGVSEVPPEEGGETAREAWRMAERILGDDEFFSRLLDRIRTELLERVGAPIDWPEESPLSSAEVVNPELVHASEIAEVELDSAALLEDGRLLLVMGAHFEVVVGAHLTRQGLARLSPQALSDLQVANAEAEPGFLPTGTWAADAGAGVDIYVDPPSRRLISVDVSSILVF